MSEDTTFCDETQSRDTVRTCDNLVPTVNARIRHCVRNFFDEETGGAGAERVPPTIAQRRTSRGQARCAEKRRRSVSQSAGAAEFDREDPYSPSHART